MSVLKKNYFKKKLKRNKRIGLHHNTCATWLTFRQNATNDCRCDFDLVYCKISSLKKKKGLSILFFNRKERIIFPVTKCNVFKKCITFRSCSGKSYMGSFETLSKPLLFVLDWNEIVVITTSLSTMKSLTGNVQTFITEAVVRDKFLVPFFAIHFQVQKVTGYHDTTDC